MLKFAVIMSHADQPEDGTLAFVEAATAGSAQDECNRATSDPGSIFEGYDFTIWPVPVGSWL